MCVLYVCVYIHTYIYMKYICTYICIYVHICVYLIYSILSHFIPIHLLLVKFIFKASVKSPLNKKNLLFFFSFRTFLLWSQCFNDMGNYGLIHTRVCTYAHALTHGHKHAPSFGTHLQQDLNFPEPYNL